MSGLMGKAADSLKGNDKAEDFSKKQVNSRTFPKNLSPSGKKFNVLTILCRGQQRHRQGRHGRQARPEDLQRHQQRRPRERLQEVED